jgi:hypothetical protein
MAKTVRAAEVDSTIHVRREGPAREGCRGMWRRN